MTQDKVNQKTDVMDRQARVWESVILKQDREKLQGELRSLQVWPFSLPDSLILGNIWACGEYGCFLLLFLVYFSYRDWIWVTFNIGHWRIPGKSPLIINCLGIVKPLVVCLISPFGCKESLVLLLLETDSGQRLNSQCTVAWREKITSALISNWEPPCGWRIYKLEGTLSKASSFYWSFQLRWTNMYRGQALRSFWTEIK